MSRNVKALEQKRILTKVQQREEKTKTLEGGPMFTLGCFL